MPNYYIHLQAAAETMERLRHGVPVGSPLSQKDADELYGAAHENRNYFAAGAYGPDLFVMLPDFLGDTGKFIRKIIDFILGAWKTFDDEFYSKWDKWMTPVLEEENTLADQITGGMLGEISQILNLFTSSCTNFVLDHVGEMTDILGLLTSGTQTGYDDKSFFWSDMFHSRKTYEFARTLYSNALLADKDMVPKQRAFALGWISHCATDVAGHPFVNAKCGGPYRTHWGRHHLIENHMDAFVYQQKQPQPETSQPEPPYGSLVTSALHLTLAFQKGAKSAIPDAAIHDYFPSGNDPFPDYPDGDKASDKADRKKIFDVDTEPFPEHICQLLLRTMQDVYTGPDDLEGPQILRWDEGKHTKPGGRPTEQMLQDMYQLAYVYTKYTASSGLSMRMPKPPDVFNDLSLPIPPGMPNDSAGADPNDHHDLNFLDIVLAIIAYLIWLAEVSIWIVTILPSMLTELATWPLRELLYYLLVMPAWDLYNLSRLPLVMEGFLVPRPSEISKGLVVLGTSANGPLVQLRADLDDPTGFAGQVGMEEPSGLDSTRGATTSGFSLDPAYPRAMVTDLKPAWSAAVLPDENTEPSEYVAPWRYPHHNIAGMRVGWEAHRTHVGPYMQGQDAGVLIGMMPGSDTARHKFEAATTPKETEDASTLLMSTPGAHLGDPVDYGVYLIGQLTGHDAAKPLPDFNLEADRGYAYHCWEYLRHAKSEPPSPWMKNTDAWIKWSKTDAGIFLDQWRCIPQLGTSMLSILTPEQKKQLYERYSYQEPYTVPQRYDPADNPHHRSTYDPLKRIAHRYIRKDLPADTGCDGIDLQVSEQEMKEAGMSPTGRKVTP